jgi:hypothetical protein
VFTEQDAEALLGGPVANNGDSPGLTGTVAYSTECSYGMGSGPYHQVFARFEHFVSAARAKDYYLRVKGLSYGRSPDAAGVGDAAYFTTDPMWALTLHALRGPFTLDMGTTRGGIPTDLGKLGDALLGRSG